jgi:tripartite-type tricarboxylate transporter receptor subunit TctC
MWRWFSALIALQCRCATAGQTVLSYPQRPITMILTAAVGGVADVVGRALGPELCKAWGQPVFAS